MLSQLRLIEASLQRLTLRAPAHGVVHDLQIVTEGRRGTSRLGADPPLKMDPSCPTIRGAAVVGAG